MNTQQKAVLIAEARAWIADCEWRLPVEFDELTDFDVVAGVARHYDGGWQGFVRDVS